jgi:hypothetical protein
MFWLALATKMAVAAAFVVIATKTAERAGSLVGAMIATLPILAAPSYFFLALEHDKAFIADSALASLVVNAVTTIFALTYAALASRFGFVLSLGAALGCWFGLAALLRGLPWTTASATALNVGVFAFSLWVAHHLKRVAMPPARPQWYDVPLRAVMVGLLVAVIVGLSDRLGPTVTGMLAAFPIVLVSLILILHPRIGGAAAASVMADTIFGLISFSLCCLTARLLVPPLGSALGLSLALAMSVGANLVILAVRRRASGAR